MITKDKFCHKREANLQLNWSRYAVWLKHKDKLSKHTSLESQQVSGESDETTMASQAGTQCPNRRTAQMGSSLSTATPVGAGATKRDRPKSSGATTGAAS